MKLGSFQHGKATIVTPREAIVDGDCEDLRRAVVEAVANGSSQIIVDFMEVPFVDSAGLELLCDLQTTCTDGGAQLKLCALDETCREILRVTDLAGVFQTYPSVEDAGRSLL